MKKALIIILTIGLTFTGCAKLNNTSNISKQYDKVNNLKTPAQISSFFFKDNVSQLNYKGSFLFDDDLEKDVKMHISEVANLKYGKLYELKLDAIEGIPNDRLNLGYFYVQKDKIYKIQPTEENLSKLKTSEELPNDSVIVCQNKEIKDTLSEDESGWHHYMELNGNKREYHSYNNKVETGYYESFIWEKNKGLINYRSGYGAESDSIELQLSND